MALDDCIQWIVSLVETEDPNAVRLSVAEADAYLASFDDVRGTKTRRDELVAAPQRATEDASGGPNSGSNRRGLERGRRLTSPAPGRALPRVGQLRTRGFFFVVERGAGPIWRVDAATA